MSFKKKIQNLMQLYQIVESRLVIIIKSYFHVVMDSNIFFSFA
jgi:hypothetical protein